MECLAARLAVAITAAVEVVGGIIMAVVDIMEEEGITAVVEVVGGIIMAVVDITEEEDVKAVVEVGGIMAARGSDGGLLNDGRVHIKLY